VRTCFPRIPDAGYNLCCQITTQAAGRVLNPPPGRSEAAVAVGRAGNYIGGWRPVAEGKGGMNTRWQPNESWRDVVFEVLARHDVSPHCDGCGWMPSVTG